MAEAKRLAQQSPGSEFYVMQVVGMAQRNDTSWFDAETQIPF